ncbi:sensor histidine kinase [Micromonospora sp. CPCC 206061]|uniref:sensor histidine kinase n=1 Tax=Micromonospora sp. CPCC 206061 TaxID=3122410 RepID=UPI002FEF4E21
MWQGWARTGLGVALGALSAVLELAYVVLAGFLAAVPGARRAVYGGARRLAAMERRRLAAFYGAENAADFTGERAYRYLAVRWAVGLLGGLLVLLFVYGVAVGAVWVWHFLIGRSALITFGSQVVIGMVLLFISVQGFVGLVALERRVARHFLGPSERERLERRITELATSRAGVVEAVDAERRRIERDLHDGVQQRLVALGMLLGRARRTQGDSDLLRQAHEEARQILDELRDVAWRAYPAALDHLGLDEALLRVAERAGLPVRVRYELTERPARPVETAAYFVVSEAVTNAAKHSRASTVIVRVSTEEGRVLVRVRDDGVGGADPAGGGLSGLARRVAALDGRFDVDSPVGGPTTIVAELPCA